MDRNAYKMYKDSFWIVASYQADIDLKSRFRSFFNFSFQTRNTTTQVWHQLFDSQFGGSHKVGHEAEYQGTAGHI